jgi:hypothetical protein
VPGRLWRRPGTGAIPAGLASSGRGRPEDAAAAERVLFGLAASRVLAPSSKLVAAEWTSRGVHVGGLGEVSDACYRATDWLHGVRGELEKLVCFQLADLLNLQVDLDVLRHGCRLFRGRGGRRGGRVPGPRQVHGLPRRPAPIVTGLTVTQEGIPVRVWCWPGNTGGPALVRQVKKDMRDRSLGRVIWAAGRGFASKANRKFLQQSGGACIIGEKLRSGSAEAQAALSGQGRCKTVTGNLQVKEVRRPGAGDRFIAGSDKLSVTKRAGPRGKISAMPEPNRFLRVTPAACSGPTWAGRRRRRTWMAGTCCAAPAPR